ncbi:chromatin assembly factor 1 subunit FAS1 [Nicotiana sylvestris]|uniref:Chromatin assembly factor 1 subunit FAS1 n=1 Tax=Nicotiana sylvestris TaxID=4096 RepID=A0A1U7VL12_NICSY|nr:PREDICTED: chromatin assembly factor 1 subunit FAS1 [Nicotiana sylvestris]
MSEPMVMDGVDEVKMNGSDHSNGLVKKNLKRKRSSLVMNSPEEKVAKIEALKEEMKGLLKYYNEVLEKKVVEVENVTKGLTLNSMIACMLEESKLSLSKLVDLIFEKIRDVEGNSSSKVTVKSAVILIGQRMFYGMPNADTDVLEDESESALWCWETRDLKLLPKSIRATLKIRRTCRKKIHERITAVSALLTALEKLEADQNCTQEQIKASEKLGKLLNEADIRLLVASMEQKNGAETAEKSVKREEKLLIKQLERNKREAEKEKKRTEREAQKEKLKSEKELKRLQSEAEKEEKKFEKEESKLKKQMMREQEEAEKDRRRKEKEEAEVKKQLTLQKQASMMERFLKRSKTNSSSQNGQSLDEPASDVAPSKCEKMPESVTLSMDSVISQNNDFNADDLWKSHLTAWNCLGRSIHSKRRVHWGIRQKPKSDIVKELKLTASRGLICDDEDNTEKLADGWVDSTSNNTSYSAGEINTVPCRQKGLSRKQLLQFDKCHRPAFYGVWPKKSQVVGARHPFAVDPDLDYEVDSDEEWEEEEPGESLSDCDKDDNECLEEECSRGEEEDESEDGFFVPDGYLSDEEGVHVDKVESHDEEGPKILSSSAQEVQAEEFVMLLRQQKYLHNLTEQALRKNKPLIILNLMREKAPLLLAEELTGNEKVEQMCLGALAICSFPGHSSIPISTCNDVVEGGLEASPSGTKATTSQIASSAVLADSDLHQVVSVIQSCSHGINKVVESLQLKFPSIGKSQLKNKVREISEFIDGRWQVKKDVLVKLGLSISPEKSSRTKSIATFFSKRCLPPSGKTINLHETSPQACQKTSVSIQPQQDCTYKHE